MSYTADAFRTTPHQVYGSRDPDGGAVVLFRYYAKENEAESAKAGRPIFDDVEVCDIRFPGSRNYGTYPALAHAGWVQDPYTGQQRAAHLRREVFAAVPAIQGAAAANEKRNAADRGAVHDARQVR